ncbi:MAG: hypothetical protein WAW73_10870 [Rhodoferax sp.]
MKSASNQKVSKIARIAFHTLRAKRIHGVSKIDLRDQEIDAITSIGTETNYRPLLQRYLHWRKSLRLSIDGPHLTEHMQEFMDELAESGCDQRYLNSVKQALQKAYGVKLQTVESDVPIILKSRTYPEGSVAAIVKHQNSQNGFTTRLCWESGLRAHESFTLERACDLEPSSHRAWDSRRFAFMKPAVIYSVRGKGGLARNVAISTELAAELELRRLPKPVLRRSRGINYLSQYDIGGGASYSQSFSEASKKALGYSHGAHGLRHSYAQRRLQDLKAGGIDTLSAMLILSQELGHFRPDIVLAYLR